MGKVDLPTGHKYIGDEVIYKIEESGVEESEKGMGEADQNEVEESDQFEDCE